MFGRPDPPPPPAGRWAGADTTAEPVTVAMRGLLGPRRVPCVRFADGETFRLDDLRAAAAGRATILETVTGSPLAFLFRADAPSRDSPMASLAAGRPAGSWILAPATGYDGAAAIRAVLDEPTFASFGSWVTGS